MPVEDEIITTSFFVVSSTSVIFVCASAGSFITFVSSTGFPSLEDAIKVIDLGAAAYLVKPVKSEELIRIITEKLKSQEKAANPR
jgi:ActR/RegA family two-component response regulator